ALLAGIMAAGPDAVVCMVSGHATIDAAGKATRLGAFDFLEKPILLGRLLVLVRNASATVALKAENRRLASPWAHGIVGKSPAVVKLQREIQLAGPSAARVLILGEN